jgi:glutathione S-transferase
MKLALYHIPRACSIVPLIGLYEAGADVEVRPVNGAKREQYGADYTRLNPKSKVPTLLIDGEPLTENVAIISWIARSFADKKLLPADPKNSIRALSMMAWIASAVHPLLPRVAAPARFTDMAEAHPSIKKTGTEELEKAFRIAEAQLTGRDWLFDQWSLVDTNLWWAFWRARAYGMDGVPFPALLAHAERVEKRPSTQRALALVKELEDRMAKAA